MGRHRYRGPDQVFCIEQLQSAQAEDWQLCCVLGSRLGKITKVGYGSTNHIGYGELSISATDKLTHCNKDRHTSHTELHEATTYDF